MSNKDSQKTGNDFNNNKETSLIDDNKSNTDKTEQIKLYKSLFYTISYINS